MAYVMALQKGWSTDGLKFQGLVKGSINNGLLCNANNDSTDSE